MDSLRSGSLSAVTYPRVGVTDACDRRQKHPANGFWITCQQIRTWRWYLALGTTLRQRCIYPGDLSHVNDTSAEHIC